VSSRTPSVQPGFTIQERVTVSPTFPEVGDAVKDWILFASQPTALTVFVETDNPKNTELTMTNDSKSFLYTVEVIKK
jgi:hypothetical protein